jgi:hypothetical protein
MSAWGKADIGRHDLHVGFVQNLAQQVVIQIGLLFPVSPRAALSARFFKPSRTRSI